MCPRSAGSCPLVLFFSPLPMSFSLVNMAPFLKDFFDPDAVNRALLVVGTAAGALLFVADKNPKEEVVKILSAFLVSLTISYLHKAHRRL